MAPDSATNSLGPAAHASIDALLAPLGTQSWRERTPLRCEGDEVPFRSPHRLTLAAVAAVGAASLGISDRWLEATGERQEIAIDALQATCGLCPVWYQRQSGHPVPLTIDTGREFKLGFYPTRDQRWFLIAGAYAHLRDGVLELLDCPNTVAAIGKATARFDAEDLEQRFFERGLTAAIARTAAEWRAHPQGAMLDSQPLVTIEKLGDGPPQPPRARLRPLDDLRVIDLGHVIAGPVLARTLAEHGADVLRISSPTHGDSLLQILDTGLGKRNAYLDLQQASDADRLKTLVDGADVVVESWRPESMARLGLGPKQLARSHRGLIYASVSMYGSEGPWADRKGFDPVAQAVSGVAVAEAVDGKPRLVPTHLLNDYLTAYLGAAGVLAALSRRAIEGGSYHVRVSLAGTAMWVQSLGRPTAEPRDIDAKKLAPRMIQRDSVFGLLEQLAPVASLSRTPAYYTLAPSPLGSAPAAWR
ncbi:MAG: CoA transferase [Lautropia sp.]